MMHKVTQLNFCFLSYRKHKHNCYCTQEILGGLRQPVGVVHCGDGSQRLFILEKEGFVRILTNNLELLKEPFLDIHKQVQSGIKVRNLIYLYEISVLAMAFLIFLSDINKMCCLSYYKCSEFVRSSYNFRLSICCSG